MCEMALIKYDINLGSVKVFCVQLMNVFLLICYKTVYLSAILQPNYVKMKMCFSRVSAKTDE